MKIYRNIQTFTFQVLRECSSWAFRNSAVQMFFLTPTRIIGFYFLIVPLAFESKIKIYKIIRFFLRPLKWCCQVERLEIGMSIERKSIWAVSVINECYVCCFCWRWSINSWNITMFYKKGGLKDFAKFTGNQNTSGRLLLHCIWN